MIQEEDMTNEFRNLLRHSSIIVFLVSRDFTDIIKICFDFHQIQKWTCREIEQKNASEKNYNLLLTEFRHIHLQKCLEPWIVIEG